MTADQIKQATDEAKQLLAAREARRAAIREQILSDQATGAKRGKNAPTLEDAFKRVK